MSFHVRLLPSGHTFFCESRESLLEAALRAGLNLNYSCSNGSCGSCKGRLLSGQFGERRHHDYPLAEAEKQRNVFLLCSNTPASDLTIEAEEASEGREIAVQHLNARVFRSEAPTPAYRILYLRTPRTQTLRFLAGQSVRLQLGEHFRQLPIASCPCNGMILQFHLRRQPQDPFVARVFDGLPNGTEVRIEGPFGDFVLDETSSRPIALVALEDGFAPLKSLLEHAIALELPQPLYLFWGAPDPQGHYALNGLRALLDVVDDLKFVPIYFAQQGPRKVAEIMTNAMQATLPKEIAVDVYLAGPRPTVLSVGRALGASGMPPLRVFSTG